MADDRTRSLRCAYVVPRGFIATALLAAVWSAMVGIPAAAQPSDFAAAGPLRQLRDESPRRIPPVDTRFDPATDGALSKPFEPELQLAAAEEAARFFEPGEFQYDSDRPAISLSGFRVVPYGAFWADMKYATERTNPGAFTLFVFSRQEQGEDAFTIDARRTRLGLDFEGPTLPLAGAAQSGGRVEIDFHGDFVTENRASVLLRHAYWEIKNDRIRLLVGQNWDVISPLIPGAINYSAGYFAGNIGFRRTQFRAERDLTFSDTVLVTLQGSLNQDIVTDFPADPGIRREESDWPVLQGRIGVILGARGEDCRPVRCGVSAHIGETGFDFLDTGPPPLNLPPQDDVRFKSWSFNVDLHVPCADRWGFQGEFFIGSNLSSFLGGIGQGVCPCLRVPIRSTGGWCEVWYDWTAGLHSHIGYGMEDPLDRDSLFGRAQNQFLFANVIVDITADFSTGLEVSWWRTLYHEERTGIAPAQRAPSEPGEAVTIDWMFRYGF